MFSTQNQSILFLCGSCLNAVNYVNGFVSVSKVDWAASLCGCQPTLGYCQQVFNIQQGSFRSFRLFPPAAAVQEGLDYSGQSPVEAWFKPFLWTQQLYGHREWLQPSENQLMALAQTGKAKCLDKGVSVCERTGLRGRRPVSKKQLEPQKRRTEILYAMRLLYYRRFNNVNSYFTINSLFINAYKNKINIQSWSPSQPLSEHLWPCN